MGLFKPSNDAAKKAAAEAALAYVPRGGVIGVGTGSTANCFIDGLADLRNQIAGAVASSEATAQRLRKVGIEVLDLNSVNELLVYVDGADEINPDLHLIKGGGGARITPFGKKVLRRYRLIEAKAAAAISGDIRIFARDFLRKR
ncbi:MAG: hypothetical protein EBV48_05085 [Betaproteobacteria bacterium]|nr:hypothetical protein [Betaproteobacteria bacterium]